MKLNTDLISTPYCVISYTNPLTPPKSEIIREAKILWSVNESKPRILQRVKPFLFNIIKNNPER